MLRIPRTLTLAALPAALLCFSSVLPVFAADPTLEVRDVRVEAYPRVVVRLNASVDDGVSFDGMNVDRLHVLEDGQPQPSAEIVQLRNPLTPVSVVLAMDISGSMADDDKLVQAQAAARSFVDQTRARDRAAVVSFNDEVSLPQPLTNDHRLLSRAIDNLSVGGNTRMYDALAQSISQLALAPAGSHAVVLLTDGADSQSLWGLDDVLEQAIRDGVPVYAIGLGPDVQTNVLQRMASQTGGRFYQAPRATDLAQVFRAISRQLTTQLEVSWVSNQKHAGGEDVAVQISLDRAGASSVGIDLTYQAQGKGVVPPPTPPNPDGERNRVPTLTGPTQEQIRAAAAVAGVAAFLLFVGLARGRGNRRLQTRLSTFVADRSPDVLRLRQNRPASKRRAPLSPLTSSAARLAARLLPSTQLQHLKKKLVQAGHQSERQVGAFLATEVALGLLLAAIGYEFLQLRGILQTNPAMGLLLAGMLGLLGLYLPYMWLRRRVEARQRALRRALPDALDLMAVSVSAGLSLDNAMAEVAQLWDGDFSRELQQVLTEMQLGASRRQAMLGLVERTQLEELRLLVAALLQADELGANLSETLSVQAEQLRIRRRQVAEEQARKAPIKMLVPLVCFIFPAMFVILLAPGMMQFMSALRGLAQHG